MQVMKIQSFHAERGVFRPPEVVRVGSPIAPELKSGWATESRILISTDGKRICIGPSAEEFPWPNADRSADRRWIVRLKIVWDVGEWQIELDVRWTLGTWRVAVEKYTGVLMAFQIGSNTYWTSPERQIELEKLGSIATRMMAALGSSYSDTSLAAQAMINLLWQQSPYFRSPNHAGLQRKKARLDDIRQALLHQIEKERAGAEARREKATGGRFSELLKACEKLSGELYVAGPIERRANSDEPPPGHDERLGALIRQELPEEKPPIHDALLMNDAGATMPLPQHPPVEFIPPALLSSPSAAIHHTAREPNEAVASETESPRRGRRRDDVRRSAIGAEIAKYGNDWREHLPEIFGALDQQEVEMGDFAGMEIDLGDGQVERAWNWGTLDLAMGKQRNRIIDALRKYV